MSDPKVSVVIPTFNRSHYVLGAVGSVLGQSFGDLELIVVDDGSTDDTAAAVRSVADPRVRLLQRRNGGLQAALNDGFAVARGAYWARLDDDDLWAPDMLETTNGVLDSRPEVGLVYGKSRAMDEGGQPLDFVFGSRGLYPEDPLRSLLASCCFGHHTTLTRRECFDDVGLFDESLRSCEDWDFFLRVARRHLVAFADRVLCFHRVHRQRLTSPSDPRHSRHLDGLVEVLEKFYAADDLPASVLGMKPIAVRNTQTDVCLRALAGGDLVRAGRAFGAVLTSGANPVVSAARLGWFALDDFVLCSLPGLRRLRPALRTARQRLRERRVFGR
jgi:glycosyltransferase involved in cell wall biosynthesis